MIAFLKNEVGCSPGEYKQRVVFYGSMVDKLPQSVREHYKLTGDWQGRVDSGKSTDDPPDDGAQGMAVLVPSESTIEKVDNFGDSGHHNQYQLHGATVLYKGDIDTIKEEVSNYIDQLNDSNNLFMTKFKNVVNTMNEALDGANSMADKSHDTVKNLVSRW